MVYRNWTITAHPTFLGYLVQYVSPIGQAHHASGPFPTDQSAISYACSRIDYIVDCQRSHFEPGQPVMPVKCA